MPPGMVNVFRGLFCAALAVCLGCFVLAAVG